MYKIKLPHILLIGLLCGCSNTPQQFMPLVDLRASKHANLVHRDKMECRDIIQTHFTDLSWYRKGKTKYKNMLANCMAGRGHKIITEK